jgi:hypothetical protein
MLKYLITAVSKNAKTGPIMVTTSPRVSCPPACPFMKNGCYAESGPLAYLWSGLDNTASGDSFVNGKGKVTVASHRELLTAIRKLLPGSLWRHNQAGDLPGSGNAIDAVALGEIVEANKGKRGFTYTHKPMTPDTAQAVKDANAQGFTINLSANTLAHADELADLNIAPVAVVLPADHKGNTVTPAGRKVVQCPATLEGEAYANVSCATCKLCSLQRDFIIGFPAHGGSKRKASAIASN